MVSVSEMSVAAGVHTFQVALRNIMHGFIFHLHVSEN